MHTHTIFFLFFSLLLLLGFVVPLEGVPFVELVYSLLLLGYLLASLRRVYGKSWATTAGRFLLMSIPYSIVFLLLLAVGTLWGFFSL